MKITCLLENTTLSQDLAPRHGLSLFIETGDTALLFDLGPDASAMDNAAKIGVDISRAQMALISHGHLDHGGGLAPFMAACPKADVLMTPAAAGKFYVQVPGTPPRKISLDPGLTKQARFISEDTRLSDTLCLFTGFDKPSFIPHSNATLFRGTQDGRIIPDDFDHELALLVREEKKTVLFTGCSHSGITNMITTVLNRSGLPHIDVVVGGFHLSSPSMGQSEPPDRLDNLAEELKGFKQTLFYTGHCTGKQAFDHLKQFLGDRLLALSTGRKISI